MISSGYAADVTDGVPLRGGSRWRQCIPLGVCLPWLVAAVVVDRGFSAVDLSPALWSVMALWLPFRHQDTVVVTDEGIVVRKRRGPERVYGWDDLLEVGWGGLGYGTAGPVVRTIGGTPFESPSPGVPSVVAALFRPSQETRDLLAEACAAHDVPYSEHILRDIHKGRRKVRLPSDAARRAAVEARRAAAQ